MKITTIILLFFSFILNGKAQNIGIGTNTPAASAQLDVTSTTKGFLPPRMTAAQRTAIASPADGLLVFQTDGSKGYYHFKSGAWTSLIEEKKYPSVTICSQKWMDKNLDVIAYRNGDSIPYVTDPTLWAALTTGAWCYYNNDPSTNATYGKLYNWYAVADPRGLAPVGWHVPTDAEWTTLISCLGSSSTAGSKLKVSGTRTWTAPNSDADNSSGWAALPGGSRVDQGFFDGDAVSGLWWSATSATATTAWSRFLLYSNGNVGRSNDLKPYGFSVRCLRD